MMSKFFKIKLHVISPINIGCDDVYEPMTFVIDKKENKLIEFDSFDFINSLDVKTKEEFNKICMQDNILEIFKFVEKNYKPVIKGRKIDISSGIVQRYTEVLNLKTYNRSEVINNFTLNKTSYNIQSKQPYIPGSSIKGSLRTAYLSKLAIEKSIRNYKNISNNYDYKQADLKYSQDLEERLLAGSFDTYPFRLLKISDFLPLKNIKTKIVYAINKKKKKSDKKTQGPPQIFEVLKEDSVFEGVINLVKSGKGSDIVNPINDIKIFLQQINKIYDDLLKKENQYLKNAGLNSDDLITKIKNKFKEKLGESIFLIRIGRHSGAEAITIEGNRCIKIIGKREEKPKYLDHATTFWFSAENKEQKQGDILSPFGWAVLETL